MNFNIIIAFLGGIVTCLSFKMLKGICFELKDNAKLLLKRLSYINFYKLQPYETEQIVKLIKDNSKECGFNYDYTIFKLEECMTDKNGRKPRNKII